MNSFIRKVKVIIGRIIILFSVLVSKSEGKGYVYNLIYSIYIKVLRHLNMSLFKVVDHCLYNDITINDAVQALETNRVGVVADIKYFGDYSKVSFKRSLLPDLFFSAFSDVCIQGNSDIIVDRERNLVISEAAYNLSSNEEVVDGLLYRASENVCLLRNNMQGQMQSIDSGIMISGKFNNNYYHVIYETLIKLIYIPTADLPESIPILVDKATLNIPSCKRIFDILTEKMSRNVILLDDAQIYCVKKLYSLSRVNVIPSHVININKPSLFIYSQSSLIRMRDSLLKYNSNKDYPKRLFISRRNVSARHYNETEIFQILEKYNFKRIVPEEYSFDDQMSLFNGAEYIVSGSGAALANLLFVNDKCTVICFGLGSYNSHCDLPIFNTIANINGAKFIYFPRKHKMRNNIHVNYEIDCEDFNDKIDYLFLANK